MYPKCTHVHELSADKDELKHMPKYFTELWGELHFENHLPIYCNYCDKNPSKTS